MQCVTKITQIIFKMSIIQSENASFPLKKRTENFVFHLNYRIFAPTFDINGPVA